MWIVCVWLGGSLIPMWFIGMGMVSVTEAIPKLRLRLPPKSIKSNLTDS